MDPISSRTAPTRAMPNLVIWLKRMVASDEVGAWVVDRLTVRANGFSHDLSFTVERQAEDQLSADLWGFLRAYLPAQTDDFVLTAREAVFESRSVLLQGLDVTAHQIKGGVQRVLLTFRNFLGSVSTIFAPNKAPNLLKDVECGLATRTLNDILLPALNAAATDPVDFAEGADDKVDALIHRLKQNKHDIEFYAALLSRFVASLDRPPTAQPLAEPEYPTHMRRALSSKPVGEPV